MGARLLQICAALLVLCAVVPAHAQDTGARREQALKFAANNSLFVLYHEMAHLLIDQFEIPVLGREEDAADNMATWTLIRQNTPEARQALTDSAQGWALSGTAYQGSVEEGDYADVHSFDKQRSYQIVCLMVGSDATVFGPIARKYALDSVRRDSCKDEYALAERSFKSLFTPRGDRSKKGAEVTIVYEPIHGPLRATAAAFKASGVFEAVANELRTHFVLRKPVTFHAQECGEANAFYEPETSEIIYCYELLDDFATLISDHLPVATVGGKIKQKHRSGG